MRPVGEELRLQRKMKDPARHGGEADWLTGSTPTLCAIPSSSSRDSLHPPLGLSGGGVGVSQRIFDHYVIKDRLKDGHPQASGDWRVILHGIPCMASRHSLPLVLPAFVRSVPFRLPCRHSLLQGVEN